LGCSPISRLRGANFISLLTPWKLYLTKLRTRVWNYFMQTSLVASTYLVWRSAAYSLLGLAAVEGLAAAAHSLGHPPTRRGGRWNCGTVSHSGDGRRALAQRAETRHRQTPPGAAFAYHCDCQFHSAGGPISRSQTTTASQRISQIRRVKFVFGNFQFYLIT
jgi:hypothetical protein